ncbi:MAG TPA: hypothetical protein VNT22_09315 [Baekduia sp.]|nr:hypothetical protein [Baekduia sp.]
MASAIVFFDVDGTLVPETSSSQYLAGHLGHLTDLAVAEAAYAAGSLTNHATTGSSVALTKREARRVQLARSR